tara:strand:- start:1229 stop:1678 length:450 start_codon:yes stop_codon:yes gene_type:complete
MKDLNELREKYEYLEINLVQFFEDPETNRLRAFFIINDHHCAVVFVRDKKKLLVHNSSSINSFYESDKKMYNYFCNLFEGYLETVGTGSKSFLTFKSETNEIPDIENLEDTEGCTLAHMIAYCLGSKEDDPDFDQVSDRLNLKTMEDND